MLRILSAAFILSTAFFFAAPQAAQATNNPNGWMGVVVARGELKQEIESTPILDRPNRPFHFYGNTVRRNYYRGQQAAQPRSNANGGGLLKRNQG